MKFLLFVVILYPLAMFAALAISSHATENRRREEERREEAEQRRIDAERIEREAEEERRQENERREALDAARDRLARLLELREMIAAQLDKAKKPEKIAALTRQLLTIDRQSDAENAKIRKLQ